MIGLYNMIWCAKKRINFWWSDCWTFEVTATQDVYLTNGTYVKLSNMISKYYYVYLVYNT